MGEMLNARHLNLYWDRYLAFDLLGAAARPLRDYRDVVVGNIRIRLDRQIAKRNDAPGAQE